ncbi:MAG: hypothetical protein JWM46_326 [Candidatus Kaiserbacteria bacterium]|nr:hypothetical protein [Candidatus Kaiserbacteria bacterium]
MTDRGRLWHRLFLRASLSSTQLFAWIFVFQYFISLYGALEPATVSLALTYALTQAITILMAPIAALTLGNGYRRPMIFAVVSLAAAFAALSNTFGADATQPAWGIAGFAVLMGLYRAFYWAPYRVSLQHNPGRNPLWSEYVLALLPVVAGFVLDGGGVFAVVLLAAASALALMSLFPLFGMRDAHEGYAWGYRETFHQLFVGAHVRTTLSSIMHGLEMSLLLIVWPIIVFVILGWSYALLGIVLSLIYVFSLILRSIIHRPMMRLSPPTRALFAASAWVMRLSVAGSVGIILIDTYYYGGSNAASRGFDMMTLEHAADNTTYVDEYTVLKEISMALGRLIMSLIVALLVSNISITYSFAIVFFIGALAAASGILLSAKKARS